MTPQLIIFDCDGVLVDSEKISTRIIAEEFTRLGLPMLAEQALQLFAGGALSRVNDYFLTQTGRPWPDDFEANYRRLSHEAYERELEPIEGVEAVLQQLDQLKCVGSNGPAHKIRFNLQKTGLEAYFGDRLYSAYDIGYWKPEPHLYLHAAKKQGIDSRQCLVVEDSVHGVEAAVAAGMRVLAYTATNDAQKLQEAGATTFDHMHQLLDLIV